MVSYFEEVKNKGMNIVKIRGIYAIKNADILEITSRSYSLLQFLKAAELPPPLLTN